MTEAEWLACENPVAMLKCLRGDATDRKLHLFGCLCCRRHWHLLTDSRTRAAVETVELWADGLTTDAELEAAETAADQAKDDHIAAHRSEHANNEHFTSAARAVSLLATTKHFGVERCQVVVGYCRMIALHKTDANDHPKADDVSLCTILRDIFGNPFRPVAFDPAWRTDTAVSLARGMYESREFSAMPILADALQDAGCEDEQILTHCRDASQPHVRGCWVCDLVLGL
jgi:hypothetical protein